MSRPTKAELAERAECLEYVRAYLADATRSTHNGKIIVYVNITSVARSGMSRTMQLYVVDHTTRSLLPLAYNASRALGYRWTENGLRVDGCGMDMRFAVLDSIARALGIGDGNAFDIRGI